MSIVNQDRLIPMTISHTNPTATKKMSATNKVTSCIIYCSEIAVTLKHYWNWIRNLWPLVRTVNIPLPIVIKEFTSSPNCAIYGYYVFSVRCRASVVLPLYLWCSSSVPLVFVSCSASLVPIVSLLLFLSSSTLLLPFTWGHWEDLKMSYRGTLLSLFCSS